MKVILILFTITIFFISFIIYHSYHFDYDKRDNMLAKVSSKMDYITPSLTFKSKEYKEFVYAK